MILTVTLNPLLERRLTFQKIIRGNENRNGTLELRAGGKGINVSRQLNQFKVDNLALTFIGGNTGRSLNEILHAENIKLLTVRSKNETRNAYVIFDSSKDELTTYFEPSPEISESEADVFLSKLEKTINNCEMIVLSGSLPGKTSNHIFPAAIEIANKLDKISVCDTYGEHLQDCINAGPTILHNNIDEIRTSLGVNLTDEKVTTEFLNSLYLKKIKQVYLTNGKHQFYCSNFDYHFKVIIPEIEFKDAVGSGDAFVAGVVYSWQKDFTFEETVTFASACGMANAASYDTCKVQLDEINNFRSEIHLSPVGKKMKLIDVSPH